MTLQFYVLWLIGCRGWQLQHVASSKTESKIWNFSFMVKSNCLFHRYGGFHPYITDHEMYHRISVLVPALIWVPEYLSTSTSTSTITLELTSRSTVRVPEIQYSSTVSTSTDYEYPSPGYRALTCPKHMWCRAFIPNLAMSLIIGTCYSHETRGANTRDVHTRTYISSANSGEIPLIRMKDSLLRT